MSRFLSRRHLFLEGAWCWGFLVRGCLVSGVGGAWPWGVPGSREVPDGRGAGPGGYLVWGISRPTTKGEVEGDLVQAHTQGGS